MTNLNLKEQILSIITKPSLITLATITEDKKPWARYMMAVAKKEDMTIRTSTFLHSRKVPQIKKNPEVHVLYGMPCPTDATTISSYLQVQGRATISTDAAEKKAFWQDEFKQYFKGPDDPEYCIIIIKPYRFEYWDESFKPKILEI